MRAQCPTLTEIGRKKPNKRTSYLGTEPWATLVEDVDMVSVADRIDGSDLMGGRYGVVLDTIILVWRGGFTNQGDK